MDLKSMEMANDLSTQDLLDYTAISAETAIIRQYFLNN